MAGNKILVTGGAGYIGSHLVKKLLKEGFFVVVLDNLSQGFIEPIKILKDTFQNLEFIRGDLANKDLLKNIFSENEIEAVFHLAAKTDVSESLEKSELYYQENFINGINLVEEMSLSDVKKIIFSSTAAVYGNPEYTPIDENHPLRPLNPYGQTKLDFEKYLSKVENLKYLILRYFNVGGADREGILGKSHLKSQDLLENIMKVVLGQKETLEIFGNDYQTADGTAIRDFIHVEDIVSAHLLALKKIDEYSNEIFNLGSEKGFSIKEIVDQASLVIGKEIPTKSFPRRQGDIAVSLASSKKAKEKLVWQPQQTLREIIASDWQWRKAHPLGYT